MSRIRSRPDGFSAALRAVDREVSRTMRFMLKAGEIEWWRSLVLEYVRHGQDAFIAASNADRAVQLFRDRWNPMQPRPLPDPVGVDGGPYR
jgi:hypothetical protein